MYFKGYYSGSFDLLDCSNKGHILFVISKSCKSRYIDITIGNIYHLADKKQMSYLSKLSGYDSSMLSAVKKGLGWWIFDTILIILTADRKEVKEITVGVVDSISHCAIKKKWKFWYTLNVTLLTKFLGLSLFFRGQFRLDYVTETYCSWKAGRKSYRNWVIM